MTSAVRLLTVSSSIVLLAACVGPVPRLDAPAATLSRIKTVAVIRMPEPLNYTVQNPGHPGMYFGMIGGLVAAADQSSKEKRLLAAFKVRGVALSSKMAERIASGLATAGYDTRLEDAPPDIYGKDAKVAFEIIKSSADAVLVVAPTMVGFTAGTPASAYVPSLQATATLLDKDRRQQLYRGFFSAGLGPPAKGWTQAAPATITFADFEILVTNVDASASALENAGLAISERVIADLKR